MKGSPRLTTLLAVAGTVLVLGACGGDRSSDVANLDGLEPPPSVRSDPATISAEVAMLRFAQCMRSNGVADFPDPQVGSKGEISFSDESKDAATESELTAAYQNCVELLDAVTATKPKVPTDYEKEDRLLEFAACMRENGFAMPDPGAETNPVDKDDPDFTDALEKCDGVLGSIEGK